MLQNPLAGLRILTLEHFGAGPYGSMLLAGLGAEVVKIESPASGGDYSRRFGPHLLGEADSQMFQTFNRGKQSLCLDLKAPGGREKLQQLAAEADALMNNLRGDQPEKLGLTYAALAPVNPRIVCAHLSAYGRGNSREKRPGYDYLMQAEAGFLSLTGEPDAPPTRFGLSMVDFMTGAVFALGLLAAVTQSRRTGVGGDVDVSLFDVALHQLSYPATWQLNAGDSTPRRPRSAHPTIAPSQLFRAQDGWLFLMCQTPMFWQRFCERMGRRDWLEDPRFASEQARGENRAALQEEIEALLGEAPVAHWIEKLADSVPIATVNSLADALANPFVGEVGMVEQVAHPARPDGLQMLGFPIRLNGRRPSPGRGPGLGEHTGRYISGED